MFTIWKNNFIITAYMEFYKQILRYLIAEKKIEDNPSTEMEIAEHFGCSRANVRDALNKLESDRLIIRKKKKGLYLRVPSPQELTESYDLRALLESYALRLMVANRSDANLKILRSLAEEYEKAAEAADIQQCLTINTQFHIKIIEFSHNITLRKVVYDLRLITDLFRFAYQLKDNVRIYTDSTNECSHIKIIEALEKGENDRAEELLKQHIFKGKYSTLEAALGINLNSRPPV